MKMSLFARPPHKECERIRLEELADDFLREHRVNGRKSDDDAEARWDIHLKSFFGDLEAGEVSSSLLTKYIEFRQKEGAPSATINREFASLQGIFNLGREHGRVREVPMFPHLKEEAVSEGDLEDGRYRKLVDYSFQPERVDQREQGSTSVATHRA